MPKIPQSPQSSQPPKYPKLPKVFVLIGDGELAEGSVWEAFNIASYYKLDNLIAILDINRLGQSQETMFGWDTSIYKKRLEAFGWKTVVCDGHDFVSIRKAYQEALSNKGKPFAVIAKTVKGKDISLLEDKDGWHGKPLSKEQFDLVVKEVGEVDFSLTGQVRKPEIAPPKEESVRKPQIEKKVYKKEDEVATRQAAGDALTELMYKFPKIVVLDGDVKNSLYTEKTQKEHPEKYLEMFIAEQNMTGSAIGIWRRGFVPFVTTFAAFMTRAYDQIRMSALAGANIKFFGSHAGVSIGEDGSSQMGLEDISMFRSLYGSMVLYPADAVATRDLMERMVTAKGISYIRTARPTTSVIYENNEQFPIGGCKVHKLKNPPKLEKRVIIVAAGITLYEALKAQEELVKDNIGAVVVDCYSIKPIDVKTLRSLVSNIQSKTHYPSPTTYNQFPTTHNPQPITNIITVEDHWPEGGLGDAVLNVFAHNENVRVHKLAVSKLPKSGKPAQLLEYVGISSASIVRKALSF